MSDPVWALARWRGIAAQGATILRHISWDEAALAAVFGAQDYARLLETLDLTMLPTDPLPEIPLPLVPEEADREDQPEAKPRYRTKQTSRKSTGGRPPTRTPSSSVPKRRSSVRDVARAAKRRRIEEDAIEVIDLTCP